MARYSIDWHPVRTLPIVGTAANVDITNRPCRLYGYQFIEITGSSPAVIRLLDGGDVNGAEIVSIALTAGQSTRDWFGQPGLLVESGVFLNVVSGAIRGAIWPLLLTEEQIARAYLESQ